MSPHVTPDPRTGSQRRSMCRPITTRARLPAPAIVRAAPADWACSCCPGVVHQEHALAAQLADGRVPIKVIAPPAHLVGGCEQLLVPIRKGSAVLDEAPQWRSRIPGRIAGGHCGYEVERRQAGCGRDTILMGSDEAPQDRRESDRGLIAVRRRDVESLVVAESEVELP